MNNSIIWSFHDCFLYKVSISNDDNIYIKFIENLENFKNFIHNISMNYISMFNIMGKNVSNIIDKDFEIVNLLNTIIKNIYKYRYYKSNNNIDGKLDDEICNLFIDLREIYDDLLNLFN